MRLNTPPFNLSNVRKLNEVGLATVLTFGKYKGETISSIVTFDASYIIHLYDTNAIQPDHELLNIIHRTKENINDNKREYEREGRSIIKRLFDSNRSL